MLRSALGLHGGSFRRLRSCSAARERGAGPPPAASDVCLACPPARLDSDSGTRKGVQGSIEALSWLTVWRMIAVSIRRQISLISAPWTLTRRAAKVISRRRSDRLSSA